MKYEAEVDVGVEGRAQHYTEEPFKALEAGSHMGLGEKSVPHQGSRKHRGPGTNTPGMF